jgi:hypothetical protein
MGSNNSDYLKAESGLTELMKLWREQEDSNFLNSMVSLMNNPPGTIENPIPTKDFTMDSYVYGMNNSTITNGFIYKIPTSRFSSISRHVNTDTGPMATYAPTQTSTLSSTSLAPTISIEEIQRVMEAYPSRNNYYHERSVIQDTPHLYKDAHYKIGDEFISREEYARGFNEIEMVGFYDEMRYDGMFNLKSLNASKERFPKDKPPKKDDGPAQLELF